MRQWLWLSALTLAGCTSDRASAPGCIKGVFREICTTDQQPDTLTSLRVEDCMPQYPYACVIAANHIEVTEPFYLQGTNPFIIVGLDSITVSSTIDVSSRTNGSGGVGADHNTTTCDGTLPATSSLQAGGGGAGGSFGGTGGRGGAGGGGAAGGLPGVGTTSAQMIGGCGGQQGAAGANQYDLASAGASGGALYLLAGHQLTIDQNGQLLACGAGGVGGAEVGGGGAGGTGGTVALEAPSISIAGVVLAEGGAGGAGGAPGNNRGANGEDGCTSFGVAAHGGAGVAGAGTGGDGSLNGDGGAASDATANAGGGGGGGGTGWIYVPASSDVSITGLVSPAP